MKFTMQRKFWLAVELLAVFFGILLFCSGCSNAAQEGTAVEKDPCDTVIVQRDTTITVTDTIYVYPADTTGTDSVFTND